MEFLKLMMNREVRPAEPQSTLVLWSEGNWSLSSVIFPMRLSNARCPQHISSWLVPRQRAIAALPYLWASLSVVLLSVISHISSRLRSNTLWWKNSRGKRFTKFQIIHSKLFCLLYLILTYYILDPIINTHASHTHTHTCIHSYTYKQVLAHIWS